MCAILGPGVDPETAQYYLDEALLAEVDPFRWCAGHLAISDAEVMHRAAIWAGLAFYDAVPQFAHPPVNAAQINMLAGARLVRATLASREIGFAAPDFFALLRLEALRRARPQIRDLVCLVPERALRAFLAQSASAALMDQARQHLTLKWPFAAAQLDLPGWMRWSFVFAICVFTLALLAAPLIGQWWLMPFWTVLISLPTLLRLGALFEPGRPPAIPATFEEAAEFPFYSVIVPLRDEAGMVDQLSAALSRLDYPPERLDILFVVEQRSPETIEAVRRHLHDSRFMLVEVPDAAPRTKPKALNYALPLCRGEFVVVFDAEDRPEPDQLRRIAGQFRVQPDVECIQARLNVDNGHHAFLQSQFAGEYAGLFSVLLPALARWNIVMPLGGTSNHFRVATLRALGGWDAFNVTEDADLGVRLARRRLRTATSSSATLESAPDSFKAWLGQRTRWMKGWMQTFLVHNRRPAMTFADLGLAGFALLQVLLMGMIVSPLLHSAFVMMVLVAALTGRWSLVIPDQGGAIYVAVLALGQGVVMLTNIVGLARINGKTPWWTQLALPVYWMLIGVATLRAVFDLAHRPFHWFKTPHHVVATNTDTRRWQALRRWRMRRLGRSGSLN
ncbi:glycosyltransferase [Devosia sp. PTR5]|uniref:Glycosyltransferase n=1 Tax=Devosia oryzisoli TaxID=2774138 RepID=A0A927FXE7_9HYPH|nr:glycosyltransferase [Devosia oryzisoli]MBD8065766.1 glycosyltransferase [Devosia oryzisoli]